MPHATPLIATIVAGLGLAFVFALLAQRLKLPAIAGYLVAGVAIGPFTPGYVADQGLANELAEIGVILLMFGVGLHFSLRDLMSVRAIAVPGALGQIAVATLLGMALASWLDWGLGAGLVFGLALSVASTVVLLRALQERRLVETERGRIAVGWLIVEDLVMVLTLVVLPPLAGLLGGVSGQGVAPPGLVASLHLDSVWGTLLLTALKVATFVLLMLAVGRKVIPAVLHYVAHTGSRELFRLAVLAIALGVAFGAAKLFGVSFALGAFFAGMVLAESPLSSQAARETLPLRDAFAVLFFVSVGMLFNPSVVITQPLALLATVLIIVVGKSLAAWAIVTAFGHGRVLALTIAASLAQIGEFSFILAVLGVDLQILSATARDLVVAGALVSILINPLIFLLVDRLEDKADPPSVSPPVPPVESLRPRVILVGHGRVGSRIRAALCEAGMPLTVIEENADALSEAAGTGADIILGAAGEPAQLSRVDWKNASCLIIAIPQAFEAGHLIEHAKAANPGLRVLARAHGDEEVAYLRKLGADLILMGEEEIARGMISDVLGRTAPVGLSAG